MKRKLLALLGIVILLAAFLTDGNVATVVISNRPQESPFNGDFLLLVKKGRTDNKY